MALDDVPDGLAVELDDRIHVELGPARSRNWALPTVVALAVVYGMTGLLMPVAPTVGVGVVVLGTVAVAAARLGAFWRAEAAMRLSWDERRLRLQRHYRDRVLWQRELGWAEVAEVVRPVEGDLQLLLADGDRLTLSAAFRSEDQLAWVTERLQHALAQHQAFEEENRVLGADQRAALEQMLVGVDRRA